MMCPDVLRLQHTQLWMHRQCSDGIGMVCTGVNQAELDVTAMCG